MTLKNWHGKTEKTSIVDGATDLWTVSGTTAGEYYHSGDGTPVTTKPIAVYINGALATEGTLGSLAAGEWAWGDQDTIGSSRLYARIAGDGDPDAQAAAYVQHIQRVTVVTVAALKTALLLSIEIAHEEATAQDVELVKLASDGTTELMRHTIAVGADIGEQLTHRVVLETGEILRLESTIENCRIFVSGDES